VAIDRTSSATPLTDPAKEWPESEVRPEAYGAGLLMRFDDDVMDSRDSWLCMIASGPSALLVPDDLEGGVLRFSRPVFVRDGASMSLSPDRIRFTSCHASDALPLLS
jgi:hypothetical protein